MHLIRVTDTTAGEKFFDCWIDKGDIHARWVKRELEKRFSKGDGWEIEMWEMPKSMD